ncbi:hypothetical protein F66182_8921 [Fusarium sp. NRRL 66182]|nr:hypothetical protein F66182_8921 [Fusarium sp. NRRL 66182]
MSNFCILCREHLFLGADSPSQAALFPVQEWETDIIGFHDLQSGGPSLRIQATPVNIRRGDFSRNFEEYTYMAKSGPFAYRRLFLQRPVFFAHVCCWKVAYQRTKLSHTQAFKLVFNSLVTAHPVPTEDTETCESSLMSPGYVSASQSTTNLARLLGQCSKLPTELHLGELVPSRDALSVSTKLLRARSMCKSDNNWLSASRFSMFGRTYLRDLEVVPRTRPLDSKASAIRIKDSAVIGIKYILGLHGISAVSLIYEDGTSTSWLGDWADGWLGCEYGLSIEHIWVTSDEFKVTGVTFDQPDERKHKRQKRPLWDLEPKLEPQDSIYVSDTSFTPSNLDSYSGFRYCHYLPLELNGKYATELRVHTSPFNSLIGFTVLHGTSGPLFSAGQQTGFVYYIHFQPGERISFIAFLTSPTGRTAQLGLGLLIQTNLGRSTFCGCAFMMRSRLFIDSCWCFVTPDNSSDVVGLVVNALNLPCNSVKGFGAAIRPRNRQASTPTWRVPNRRLTSSLHTGYEQGFLTLGSLRHVYKVQVQKTFHNCTGMRIYHHDGSLEVMGRWQASNDACDIVDIYDSASGGILHAISVHYLYPWNNANKNFIVKIVAGEDPEDERVQTFKVDENSDLCWWLADGCCIILPWEGLVSDVSPPDDDDSSIWATRSIWSSKDRERIIEKRARIGPEQEVI